MSTALSAVNNYCRLIGGKNSDFLFSGFSGDAVAFKQRQRNGLIYGFYSSGKFTKRRFLCQRKLTSPSTVMRFDFEKKAPHLNAKAAFLIQVIGSKPYLIFLYGMNSFICLIRNYRPKSGKTRYILCNTQQRCSIYGGCFFEIIGYNIHRL